MTKQMTPILFATFFVGFLCGYLAKPSTLTLSEKEATSTSNRSGDSRDAKNAVPAKGPGSVAAQHDPFATEAEFEALRARWNDSKDLGALLTLLEITPSEASSAEMMGALSMARDLSADSFPALVRLVGIASKFGAHPLALMTAQSAMKLDSKNPEPYRLAGRICMFDLEDYGQAAFYYEEYLKLDPNGAAAPMIRQALEMMKSGEISARAPLGAPMR